MINEIKEAINNCVQESSGLITLDDITNYNDRKVEVVLSIKDYMASVSILSDHTYDFMAIEIETESILMNKTKTYINLSELIMEMKEDVSKFSNLA